MRVGLAQIAPVFLDKALTLQKVIGFVERSAAEGCGLVSFGETLIPGYPIWPARTDGARFEAADQKEFHSRYLDQAVSVESGDLSPLCKTAARLGIAVIVGVAEKTLARGGTTIFCSRVFIGGKGESAGQILSIHRKLMPTYEERLAWGIGDGAGLRTHAVGPFQVGSLNCWENWMPLARAALYAQGEDLHVAIWPGGSRLTQDITRFIARESRSFVVSSSNVLRESDLPLDIPQRDRLAAPGELLYDGGSCVAAPDGSWMLEPVIGREGLFTVDLDPAWVRRERQSFDPAGHYSRPDVLQLIVDRRRQDGARFLDE